MSKGMHFMMIFAIVLSHVAQADDPVYFADPNLKACVEEHLVITNPTLSDMLALTSLTCTETGITDLTGLECALNLQTLNISDNQIGDISSLTEMQNLVHLELQDNFLDMEAYCCHLPVIKKNNPGAVIIHDPCPDSPLPLGDFNADCWVEFNDFVILASAWLSRPSDDNWNSECDISIPADDSVDMLDFTVFTEHWLKKSGLVAYWPFDEMDGSIAVDSAGDNDGIVHGATWTEGKISGALNLNGFNNYVDCGDSDLLGPEQLTLAMWLQPRHMGGTRYIVSRAQVTSEAMDYAIKRLLDGEIEFVIAQDKGEPVSIVSSAKIPLEAWSHVAVTRDGERVSVYINGELDSSAVYAPSSDQVEHRFIIGSLRGESRFYNGKIDDVRVYDRAVSAEDIAALAD